MINLLTMHLNTSLTTFTAFRNFQFLGDFQMCDL